MNRIYQGRVSKVEILTDNKDNPWQRQRNIGRSADDLPIQAFQSARIQKS